jgi:hypothetical protein
MQPNPRRGDSHADVAVQRAILALLLAGEPVPRTIPELVREFGDRERVERAVSTLESVGLLEALGGVTRSLRPTCAARACHRLEAW